MRIMGINSVFHDSAACLLSEGDLIAAAEEERFTQVRHAKVGTPYSSWILPFHAINYCLEQADMTISDLDHIAYSFQPSLRFFRNLPMIIRAVVTGKWERVAREIGCWYFNQRVAKFLFEGAPRNPSMRRRFVLAGTPKWKLHFVEHHLAHAASAFFVSPFEDAAILSADGIGETTCTLMAVGRGKTIEKLKEIHYPHSLGFFYEEITKFLGFQRNHDEYKVMGLAAYGKPRFYEELKKLIALRPGGEYQVNIDFRRPSLFGAQELHGVLGSPRLWGSPLTERHADIAASAQKVLEEAVLHLVEWLHTQTRLDTLCLAGGVALNCLMNERVRAESGFRHVFVQPAANDAGTALGAALWVYHSLLGYPRSSVMEHAYLGPEFSDAEVQMALDRAKIVTRRSADIARECAEAIAQGKIIGWFQGRMEWGPRALGNRSILADPRDLGMKDRLNQIKGREEFRPLSPAVLEEAVGKYFECDEPSPFMLFARKVRSSEKALIPAVVHVDGTARFQSVSLTRNPLFYRLIEEFYKITGIPMLVNTSLNYQGKPIVCTIEQALECFYNTGLDLLAIGNYLVGKTASH